MTSKKIIMHYAVLVRQCILNWRCGKYIHVRTQGGKLFVIQLFPLIYFFIGRSTRIHASPRRLKNGWPSLQYAG